MTTVCLLGKNVVVYLKVKPNMPLAWISSYYTITALLIFLAAPIFFIIDIFTPGVYEECVYKLFKRSAV